MRNIIFGIVFAVFSTGVMAGPWPADSITTIHVDSATDDPSQARAEIYNTMLRVKDIIGARGSASGIAGLDGSALLPLANIPATLVGKSADTLDGIDSSAFARRDVASDFTVAPTINGQGIRTNANIFHGRVAEAGNAIRLPAGWSVSRPSTGRYDITHNLGHQNYTVNVTLFGTPSAFVVPMAIPPNSNNFFSVWMLGSSGIGAGNGSFYFSVYLD